MNWRESFTVGILMNTKGLVEIIVLNLGLKAGIINDKIFSIFVVMAVATTVMTVPIVSVVYPESYYLNVNRTDSIDHSSASDDTVEESENKTPPSVDAVFPQDSDLTVTKATEVRALFCLPSLHSIPSAMAFTEVLSTSRASLTVSALRLLEISERMSSVMLANEFADTLKTDPALQIFRSFADLRSLRSKLLLGTIPDSRSYAPNVLAAARDTSSTLIILPWVRPGDSTTLADFDEKVAEQSHDEILASNSSATVVMFLDRGLGRPASSHTPVQRKKSNLYLASPSTWTPPEKDTTPSSPTSTPASPLTNKPIFDFFKTIHDTTTSIHRHTISTPLSTKKTTRAPAIVVLFFGGADDREALKLASILSSAAPLSTLHVVHVHLDGIASTSTETLTDPDATSLQTLTTLHPRSTVHSVDASPSALIDAQLTVSSVQSGRKLGRPLGAVVGEKVEEVVGDGLCGGDVVVVGEGVRRVSATVGGVRSGMAGVRAWVEGETGASVMVVRAGSGEKEKA